MLRRLVLVGAGAIALFFGLVSVLLVGALLLNQLPLNAPPGLATRLDTYFNTNVAEIKSDSPFPELHSPRYVLPPAELFRNVTAAMTSLGWQVTEADATTNMIRAVVTIPFWGFQDDVRVQVLPLGTGESSLYAYSASRVGKGDVGTNSRHLLNLLEALDKALITHPS